MTHSARSLKPTAAIARAVAATIEPLEYRRLLSTVTNVDSLGDNDGLPDIKITGTSGTDRITIYLDPRNNYAAVHDDKNGNGNVDSGEFESGDFPETFDVSTLGGTDTVNVRLLSDLAGSLHQQPFLTASPDKLVGPEGYYHEGISIYVDLGSGNDKFEISSPTAALPPNISSTLSEDAGFAVDSDPDGADIVEGGDLVVQVDGGSEKDTINFNFSRTSIICSSVLATADAGSGDDTVNLTLPDFRGSGEGDARSPEEGIVACFEYYSESTQPTIVSKASVYGEGVLPSNVSVAIDLGSGKNTLNIYANTLVSASDVHIEVDGGKDTDIINDNESLVAISRVIVLGAPDVQAVDDKGLDPVPIGGRREASYVVDIELGSGNDTYNQNVDFEFRRIELTRLVAIDFDGEVTYNVRGDSGKDIIKVKDVDNGLDPSENTALISGKLEYNLYGGTDDDNIQFDTNPGSQFALRGGELKVLVSCDGGNDFGRIDVALVPLEGVIIVGAVVDPAILTLSGGSGNDKLGMMVEIVPLEATMTPVKGPIPIPIIPRGFFGARGYPLLDGGSGSDRYDTEGNVTNIIVTRGAETLDETIEPAYIP